MKEKENWKFFFYLIFFFVFHSFVSLVVSLLTNNNNKNSDDNNTKNRNYINSFNKPEKSLNIINKDVSCTISNNIRNAHRMNVTGIRLTCLYCITQKVLPSFIKCEPRRQAKIYQCCSPKPLEDYVREINKCGFIDGRNFH